MKAINPKENSCVFCREIRGGKDTNFARLYPEYDTRKILTSGEVFIMPCIGQLTKNHCLLLPEQHYNTISEVALDHLDDIQSLINTFDKTYITRGEKLLLFEHGAKSSCFGGCGIYHAHLHILSIHDSVNPTDIFQTQYTNKFTSVSDSFSYLSETKNYILFGTATDGFYSTTLLHSIESQFLRKRLAKFLNQNEWDWKKYNRQQSVIDMISAC